MATVSDKTFWATQSPTTEPGPDAAAAIAQLPADIAVLRDVASRTVFHFRAGNYEKAGVPQERAVEANTRYAREMFELLLARTPGESDAASAAAETTQGCSGPLSVQRPGNARVVGCCRDATVLLLSLLRAKGIPARGRVGFMAYAEEGWWMDHEVVEVWDEAQKRWRMMDAQLPSDYEETVAGEKVNLYDLRPGVDFLTGAVAWKLARSGDAAVDVSKFVVIPVPGVGPPFLRGWPYLAHNVVHDLTALAKTEMLLWDTWGVQKNWVDIEDPQVPEADRALLDKVCAVTGRAPDELSPDEIKALAARDGLAVPKIVLTANPLGGPMPEVEVSRHLGIE